MAKIVRYKIRCTTENKDKEWILDKGGPAPSKCPNVSTHTVLPAEIVEELDTLTAVEKAKADKDLADEKAAKQAEKDAKLAAQAERDAVKAELAVKKDEIKVIQDQLKALVPKKFKFPSWRKK